MKFDPRAQICTKCQASTNHFSGICQACRRTVCRICRRPISPNGLLTLCQKHQNAYKRAQASGLESEYLHRELKEVIS